MERHGANEEDHDGLEYCCKCLKTYNTLSKLLSAD